MGPLEGNGRPDYGNMKKFEVLCDFLASFFTEKSSSHIAQITKGKGRDWENVKSQALKDQVQDHLRNLRCTGLWDLV